MQVSKLIRTHTDFTITAFTRQAIRPAGYPSRRPAKSGAGKNIPHPAAVSNHCRRKHQAYQRNGQSHGG